LDLVRDERSGSVSEAMRYKAVFLDVYATLLEVDDMERVYRGILARHGCVASSEQVGEWIISAREAVRPLPSGIGPDHSIDPTLTEARREAQLTALLKAAGVGGSRDACRAALRSAWTSSELFPVYEDVAGALDGLKRAGLIVGAVSNWDARLTQLLASNDIAGHFDFILASESAGFAKPSPRLFDLALDLAGVEASQVVHAGDDFVNDVQAAQSLGIAAVMVRRRAAGTAEHSPAIDSLDQLLPLVCAEAWLSGKVEGGKMQAAAFTRLVWVRNQVRERLGFDLYPGTLNLRLEGSEDLAVWESLRNRQGIALDAAPGFCEARCYPVSIEGRFAGAIIWPLLPGYPSDVVEVLAPVRLREVLPVEDGSSVTLAIP
jgi:riboflavin kinase, archaea type